MHAGVARAHDSLAVSQDAVSTGDGPPDEADIADDDLGQFIRTPDEIELLGLLRQHLFRSEQVDTDGDQPEGA